jgi:hypothetical protein
MRARLLALAAFLGLTAMIAHAEDLGPESNRREERFATEEVTRDRIFGPGRTWRDSAVVVDSSARRALHDQTGLYEEDSILIMRWTADANGRLAGAYRVTHEVGKHLPFDFLVAMDERLSVRDVVVLTYREARGGEVQRARFTGQFRGKTARSPLSLNRDIVGISGATLSAQATSRGVKKTLWWAARFFRPAEQAP